MPNHVTNRLTLVGPEADVAAVQLAARGPTITGEERDLTLHAFVPQPDGIYLGNLGRREERLHPLNWYTWNREHWGTKWDAYAVRPWEGVPGGARVTFDTAWNPPTPVVQAIARRWPALTITHEYFDEGWNFAGVETYAGGELDAARSRETEGARADRAFMEKVHVRVYGPDAALTYREWQDEDGEWQEEPVLSALPPSVLDEDAWTDPAVRP